MERGEVAAHGSESGAGSLDQRVDVRVLSYNVRSMRDDNAALFSIIRSVDPDVAAIQEAPRFLRWRSKNARLARESGLVVLTGGRPAAAMLLLGSLRTSLVYAEDVKLPKRLGLHQRGIAIAVVDLPGPSGAARLCVASVHLSLNADERVQHVPIILSHVHRVSRRYGTANVVVAGDMNESPTGPVWQRMTEPFGDPATQPLQLRDAYAMAPSGGEFTSTAAAPRRRIDAIFVSADVEVVSCGVPENLPGLAAATDHRPVLAILRIPAMA